MGWQPWRGSLSEPAPGKVVERERKADAVPDRGDDRQRQRQEEGRVRQRALRAEAEVERGDAEEHRDAVGDDDEEPGVAVVALVEEPARGAALVRFDEALEQRTVAALRTAAAKAAA